ncbi:unnamed protein product [Phaeothamnion confervicola]
MTYDDLPGFEAACDSPYINWTQPHALPDEAVDPLKFTYRGSRGYNGDRSYPSSVDTRKYYPLYMINENVDFLAKENFSAFPASQPDVEYIISASNRGLSYRMLESEKLQQAVAEMGSGPRPVTGFACAFYYLCQPNTAVRLYYEPYWDALRRPGVFKVAVNVRVGDQVFEKGEQPSDAAALLRMAEPYFECARRIEAEFAIPGQQVVWYFMSDSHVLKTAAASRFGSKLLTDGELRMVHPDCKMHNAGNCAAQEMEASMQHSIGQLLTFSLADYHVYTKESGFGRLGAWLSGKEGGNLFPISTRHSGTCNPRSPTPPAVSATQSGTAGV